MALSKQTQSQIKRSLFIIALLPLIRLIWLGSQDQLGANPVEFITHSTGTWALVALLLSLAVTPMHRLLGLNWVIPLRRMLGLYMFFYASLHFLTYLWLDHWFDWPEISQDILKHPYVLVGFLAFILSIPLAVTSNDGMVRKLKHRWKQLHRLVYPIAILVVLHYVWLVKKDISQPLIYAGILTILLGCRLMYQKRLKT
ncbi:sulfoxide reductase heme-binding subunit YedZ [Methylobacillus gramineus]|uniref:sulfite oxidase heme-binding subunit YedZ n=1 Tax=Methylobacillus gramineus TaxID=755169 RepID=UPI001CFF9C8F|nr:protein-methionine-sulfoxide reductase heme-binding subunit MsrQ [Methylobacillus gramineus]MCB5184292.1 sulfoxide reductase heme-binding subunit YedZ [Methylobacillus gramineus]